MYKRIIINILLVVLSILSIFIVFELSLRFIYSHKIDYNIEMWRYGQEISIPTGDERGHFQRASAQTNLMGAPVSTNTYGLRKRNK